MESHVWLFVRQRGLPGAAQVRGDGSKVSKKAEKPEDQAAETEPVRSTGYRVVSVVRTVFVYALAIAIILAAAMFAANRSPDKSIFGYRYYTVLTPSMSPTYDVGDMVFVRLKNGSDINVGDVITFNPSADSEAYLTHRVTERIDNYEGSGVICFRTKGDANDTADSFLIDEDRVIGTVELGVPKLGLIVRFVQLRWYFVVPLILLLALFFHLLTAYFSSGESDDTDAAGDDDAPEKNSQPTAEEKEAESSSSALAEEKTDKEEDRQVIPESESD
ncbi:MAG: signal peptidase I [Ruminococcus sp.]|nr:signal peptidase I [Ruminococcus sp.]MBR2284623.1 signal peptidase I [Ruminococcus sp.]